MNNIAKLPVWAQKYIRDLERVKDKAVRKMNEVLDSQTESCFYTDDMICTENPPKTVRRYFQGDRISCRHNGIELDVYANKNGRIRIYLNRENHAVGDIAILPASGNCIEVLAIKQEAK